jgi:hypothetical protein
MLCGRILGNRAEHFPDPHPPLLTSYLVSCWRPPVVWWQRQSWGPATTADRMRQNHDDEAVRDSLNAQLHVDDVQPKTATAPTVYQDQEVAAQMPPPRSGGGEQMQRSSSPVHTSRPREYSPRKGDRGVWMSAEQMRRLESLMRHRSGSPIKPTTRSEQEQEQELRCDSQH